MSSSWSWLSSILCILRVYLRFQVGDIPADMAEQAEEYREKLVELAVEQDDDAMEMYLEVGGDGF